MARFLRDRRTGEIFGWNYEMSKLKYMRQVDDSDADFNDGKPDEDYTEDESGFPVAKLPADIGKPEFTDEVGAARLTGEQELGDDPVAEQQRRDGLKEGDNPPQPPTEAEIKADQQRRQDQLAKVQQDRGSGSAQSVADQGVPYKGGAGQDDEPAIAKPSKKFDKGGEPPWAVDTQGNRLYEEGTNKPLVYVLDDNGNVTMDGDEPALDVYEEPTGKKKK
jgi:hypothetical protein